MSSTKVASISIAGLTSGIRGAAGRSVLGLFLFACLWTATAVRSW